MFQASPEQNFLPVRFYARSLMPLLQTRLLLWTSVVFVLMFLLWAYCASLDEVTHAEGKVIPFAHMQVVQNLEGGILKDLYVKVGDTVQAGTLLLSLDDTQFRAQWRELAIQNAVLEARKTRLQAETQGTDLIFDADLRQHFPEVVASEEQLFATKKESLSAQLEVLEKSKQQQEQEEKEIQSRIAALETRLALQRKEFSMTEQLLKQQAVSQVDMLRQQKSLDELIAAKEAAVLSEPRLAHAVAEVCARIEDVQLSFKNQAQKELTQAQQDQAKISENLRMAQDRLERTQVRSPLQGLVNAVFVTTLGGIIQSGQPLVEIVPTDSPLVIEAHVRPQDIGFIHIGQSAMIKISAYDFSVYGGIVGEITQISPSTQWNEKDRGAEPFYLVSLTTSDRVLKSRGLELPILPGMSVNVDILTGHKTVLDYLLKPILKTKQEALGER